MYQQCLDRAKKITESYRKRWWAAADAVNKGTPPPPAAPDYASANREGIIADVESLPARKAIEAAAGWVVRGLYQSVTGLFLTISVVYPT